MGVQDSQIRRQIRSARAPGIRQRQDLSIRHVRLVALHFRMRSSLQGFQIRRFHSWILHGMDTGHTFFLLAAPQSKKRTSQWSSEACS